MSHVVFLDYASTSHNDLDLHALQASCTRLDLWEQTSPEDLIAHINQAEIIISNKVILNADTLTYFSKQIKLICVAATGTNNIDLVAAKHLGIPVCNVRNYGNQSVAEHCISLIFALSRQLLAYHQAVQQQVWQHSQHFCLLDYPITNVAGKTLGIIGYGSLGQATAQLARALGMNILIAERIGSSTIRPERVSLDTVFKNSDIISLHCPLTPETKELINKQSLQSMKPSAFLINTARGGLVNEADLLEALQTGVIAGAALDVLSVEPPTPKQILLQQTLPNLIITPHIAWASKSARQTLLNQLAEIIREFQAGKLMNLVN